jgi:hypothetical protein
MRTKLLVPVMGLVAIAGLGFGWYEHERAERAEHATAKPHARPRAPSDCSHGNLASLTRAVSTLVEARRSTHGDAEVHAGSADETTSFDELSADDQAKVFEPATCSASRRGRA